MPNFTKNDKAHICDYVYSQFQKRQSNRRYFDMQVSEIDRQLRMEPDISVKKKPNGEDDETKSWMPEAELPLQSQTLEVTQADVMRMLGIQGNAPWFCAHSNMTDDYLDRVDFTSLISGDQNDVPSKLNQDNADKLVYGVMNYWHNQSDFRSNISMIVGEAIKYSLGIGRARVCNKRVFLHTSQGVMRKDIKIPFLVPRSIKNVYPDDSPVFMMNEGHIVSPGQIFYKKMKLQDVKMAAMKGSSNINDMVNGGWVKNALNGLEEDDNGDVEFIEWEGDLIVPRKATGSMYWPNGIWTIVKGSSNKKQELRIVRIRKNDNPFSSYIEFPFHREHLDSPYGSSPLIKGRAVQDSAVFALNRLLEVAALNAQPPIGYDEDDFEPNVFPGARNKKTEDFQVMEIGDPVAMSQIYGNFLSQYADVTAVNAPRLGAQTVSHTTAFSKDVELQRGQLRTVDFSNDTLSGPLKRWLDIEYYIGRQNMTGKVTFFIPQYGGWVDITKSMLPEEVSFDAYGAGGPAEEQQKKAMRFAALNQAVQLDTLKMQQQAQLGQAPVPRLDLDAAIDQILTEGGWTDIDAITRSETVNSQPQVQGGMAGNPGVNPGNVSTALQALAFGGGNT